MNGIIDISGCWVGIATSGASSFRYHWCLHQVADQVDGVISLSMPDNSRRGSYSMRGQISGTTLQFHGVEFIENPGNWCMASGVLDYAVVDGLPEMRGYWGPLAIPGGCPPGCRGGVVLRKRSLRPMQ